MITNKQLDRICDLLVDYRKAIVELTTAAPEDRMAAAYEFAAIDQMVHEMLASWVEPEDTAADAGGWIEWGGGKRPVGCNEPIEIRFRNGEEHRAPPVHHYEWRHLNNWSDIIAYRVVS